MPVENIKSPAGFLKIVTTILGFIILVLGMHSHFESAWISGNIFVYRIGYIKPYQLCEVPGIPSCPDISMERYFISIVIISFIVSCCSLAASLILDVGSLKIKLVDLSCHVLAASLLFTASIVYIYSAKQINNMMYLDSYAESMNFHKKGKVAAGSLGIVQALLYSLTAFFIAKVHKLRGV